MSTTVQGNDIQIGILSSIENLLLPKYHLEKKVDK
jgi:hypothetical protein